MQLTHNKPETQKGFGLIELIVVIAIIGILSGIISTRVVIAREKARIAAGQAFERNMITKLALTEAGTWTFDNIVGATVPDSSGYNNDGTAVNGPIERSGDDCMRRGCLEFDGVDDYVDTNTALGMGTDDMTIAAWVKLASSPGDAYPTIVSNGGYSEAVLGYWFFIDHTTGQIRASVSNGVSRVLLSGAGPDLRDDRWHFVHVLYERDGDIITHVDTKRQQSSDISAYSSDDMGGFTDLFIGGIQTGINDSFDGSIDDVRIWSRALTSTEIGELYEKNAPRFALFN